MLWSSRSLSTMQSQSTTSTRWNSPRRWSELALMWVYFSILFYLELPAHYPIKAFYFDSSPLSNLHQGLALALVLLHRKKGIHTSGSLFLFWTLLTVYTFLNYRLIFVYFWFASDEDNPIQHVESVRSYIFKTIEFPLILSQLFLAFFADLNSQVISSDEGVKCASIVIGCDT